MPAAGVVTHAGFFKTFVFEDEVAMNNIRTIAMEEKVKINLTTGYRCIVDPDRKDLIPFLSTIVQHARDSVNFPCRSKIISQVMISVAPPAGSRSSFWRGGKVHRDFDDLAVSGCYTFELLLDELNEENGGIQFWPKSMKKAHDKKHPSRGFEGMEIKLPVGKSGTVLVWDSRMLHKSLPNKTEEPRTAIVWLVSHLPVVSIVKATR